jgi:inorganic pyrophosphatase
MVDNNDADDKIIAVLENDFVWGNARDISDLPEVLIERLQHYFLTYKLVPGELASADIKRIYGYEHALQVVDASIEDYKHSFGKYIDVKA